MNVALDEGAAVLILLPDDGAEGSVPLTPNQLLQLIAALSAVRETGFGHDTGR